MKPIKYAQKLLLSIIAVFALQYAFAQKHVEVNGQDVGSWLGAHWIWVAVAIVILIVLLIAALGSRRGVKRRSTTVVKDAGGHVKSVTTREDL